jgi:deazaflavin-dependent oxidoreductase (nitroreductase family)
MTDRQTGPALRLPTAAYRLIGWFSVTRFDRRLHPLLYRLTDGRGPLGRVLGCETVLLTTVGRRSGLERTVALFAFRDGGSWVVVASRGGSRRIPDWYRNLVANPSVRVRHRETEVIARARDAADAEYERLFALAAESFPGYALYREASPVRIPVVLLEPSGPAA